MGCKSLKAYGIRLKYYNLAPSLRQRMGRIKGDVFVNGIVDDNASCCLVFRGWDKIHSKSAE